MADNPEKSVPADFADAAARSREAGIADESAGYVNALASDPPRESLHDSPTRDDDIPMTGEEDPLAEVSEGDFADVVAAFSRSEREAGHRPIGAGEAHDPAPDDDDAPREKRIALGYPKED